MKAAEIRELTELELVKALDDARREQLNLRIQQKTGQIENTARMRQVRRHVARLVTESTTRAKQQREG